MSALLALSEAVENCDPYTRGHSARVARMAYEIGLRLDCDETELTLLRLGGALHDVGKLGVRDEVLNPEALDTLPDTRGGSSGGGGSTTLSARTVPLATAL